MHDWVVAIKFQFMALAIDVKDGHGSSNEMRLAQLQAKKDCGKTILAVNITAKGDIRAVHY